MNNNGRATTHPRVPSEAWAISVLALVFALACDSSAARGSADGGSTVDGSADGGESSVRISIQINNCPNVTTSASPLSTSVGATIDVMGMGNDIDLSDRLTYLWTAVSGAFADAKAPNTTYTCTEPGTHVLTVRVSDGRCEGVSAIPVTCS